MRPAQNQPHRYRPAPVLKPVGAEPGAQAASRDAAGPGGPGKPAADVAPVAEAVVRAPAARMRGGAKRTTVPWWNPLAWLSERGGPAGGKVAPVRRDARRQVQFELALDDVKPCRNDLTEGDWELAPAAPAAPKPGLFRRWAGGRAEAATPVQAGGQPVSQI